jgi:hypothetical protein
MNSHFDFNMIIEKLRIQIPSNIKFGLISNSILQEASDNTRKIAVSELRNEYKSGLYADQINTPEKLEHVLATLEKIAQKKYNFDKANIAVA